MNSLVLGVSGFQCLQTTALYIMSYFSFLLVLPSVFEHPHMKIAFVGSHEKGGETPDVYKAD